MIELQFPDGAARAYPEGVTGRAVAEGLSKSLAKKAALVRLNGEMLDLDRSFEQGGHIEILTRDHPDVLFTIRHDTAHVLAEAVQALFPGTQVTIGPPIEDGFYYDFARDEPFSLEDLPRIEAKMREIVARDAPFRREVWPRADAIAHFETAGEGYKAELIRDLPEGETITVYHQGEWLDLCRGPHQPSTRFVGQAFKLTKLAGAYWRGDHNKASCNAFTGPPGPTRTTWKPTSTASRRRNAATTAGSAAPWTCSTSRTRPRAWCSGIPRAGRCGARWKATCAAGSRPPAISR